MFNNDVTKNYNQLDATAEILIMLIGAFLLGYLMSWLLNKMFRKTEIDNIQPTSLPSDTYKPVSEPKYASQTTSTARTVNNRDKPYSTPRIDDLTRISGISPQIQDILRDEGVKSFTDLRDIKKQTLKSIKDFSVPDDMNKKEVETWPHQASLAAKGDWNKLSEYQAFISRSQKASQKIENQPRSEGFDDLKVIEGIGPRIEEILNAKSINTFKELSNTDTILLKNYIVDADDRFSKNETESWPHQAAMAEKGQWEELNIYQEFMHSETTVTPDHEISDKEHFSEAFLEDYDDLKKIDGIGPKIEEVLNKSGIYTYSQLHNSKQDRLKDILNQAGNRYQMHNPDTWPHQAGMADRKEWEALTDYQKTLQISEEAKIQKDSSNSTDIELNTKDDLKRIEGIGPKIQELLGNAGIYTFSDLSKSKRDDIKKLLDAGGPQYRVHEPESWPQQAKLAHKGQWEELHKLQEELIGGRS